METLKTVKFEDQKVFLIKLSLGIMTWNFNIIEVWMTESYFFFWVFFVNNKILYININGWTIFLQLKSVNFMLLDEILM